MIKKVNGQVRLEFGKGTMHAESGAYVPEDSDMAAGLIVCRNFDWTVEGHKKMGISDKDKDDGINVDDYPVIITFSSSESIDIMVELLLTAKSEMQRMLREAD